MSKKKLTIILIIIVLVVVVFSCRTPRAKAADLFYMIYQYVILPLIRQIAFKLNNVLVNALTGTTSALDQKSPHFITSWRNNILSGQARGNDIFRSVLADATLCPYFRTQVLKAFGADKYMGTITGSKVGQYSIGTSIPGLPSFRNSADCTLASNFNATTFRSDFTKGGGWDTWNKLIQPQNNFFGVYVTALNEQAKQIALEDQANTNQNIANQGFLPNKLGTTATGGQTNQAAYTACENKCNTNFNDCMKQNSPDQNPNASGKYTSVCSDDLKNCDASCKSQATASSGSSSTQTTSVEGCLATLPGTSRCIYEGKTVTPGNVFSQVNAEMLANQMERLQSAQSIGDIIGWLVSNITSNMLSRFNNMLGQDLFGLAVNNGMFTSTDYQSQLNQAIGKMNVSGQACNATCDTDYNQCVNSCSRDPNNPGSPEEQCGSNCSQRANQCRSMCQ